MKASLLAVSAPRESASRRRLTSRNMGEMSEERCTRMQTHSRAAIAWHLRTRRVIGKMLKSAPSRCAPAWPLFTRELNARIRPEPEARQRRVKHKGTAEAIVPLTAGTTGSPPAMGERLTDAPRPHDATQRAKEKTLNKNEQAMPLVALNEGCCTAIAGLSSRFATAHDVGPRPWQGSCTRQRSCQVT